jgi:hypothetical protein
MTADQTMSNELSHATSCDHRDHRKLENFMQENRSQLLQARILLSWKDLPELHGIISMKK